MLSFDKLAAMRPKISSEGGKYAEPAGACRCGIVVLAPLILPLAAEKRAASCGSIIGQPASASIHEEATYRSTFPSCGFHNLVIYKQDVAQNSLESIVRISRRVGLGGDGKTLNFS